MTDDKWWRESAPEVTWPLFEEFKVFLKFAWKHLNLPNPTPVQNDIADYLQYGPRRGIIEAFRGVGKSWIASAFVCWLLLRNPQLNILVVSASKERADQFTTFTLRLIAEMEVLQHLYPETHQRNSKIAFDVAPAEPDHAPSVKSVGVLGQMAGSRADIIIPDDVEVPNNSDTQMMREKLSERVKEFDAILKPGGRIIYLGTPQTEESLYNALPQRGYEVRIWPAQVPNPAALANYGERLAPMIAKLATLAQFRKEWNEHGAPTDPRRFHREDLMEREASYGRSGYALQFMLDTQLSDADRYPLKLKDLIVRTNEDDQGPEKVMYADENRTRIADLTNVGFSADYWLAPFEYGRNQETGTIRMHPYQGCVIAVDPSGRGKDETVWCALKMLNSQLFLMEMGASREGYTDATLQAIADCAKKHKANHVVIEANFGDGMFEQLLQPFLTKTHQCGTEEVRHSIQKEKRIVDTLEPVMNQHRLIVHKPVIEWDYQSTKSLPAEQANQYRLFYQMTRLTKEKGALTHDDRVDCLSIAVNYWVESMAADAEKQMQEHRRTALEEEMKAFVSNAKGVMVQTSGNTPANLGHNGGPSWLDDF